MAKITSKNQAGKIQTNFSSKTIKSAMDGLILEMLKNNECWKCGKFYDASQNLAMNCPHCGADATPF